MSYYVSTSPSLLRMSPAMFCHDLQTFQSCHDVRSVTVACWVSAYVYTATWLKPAVRVVGVGPLCGTWHCITAFASLLCRGIGTETETRTSGRIQVRIEVEVKVKIGVWPESGFESGLDPDTDSHPVSDPDPKSNRNARRFLCNSTASCFHSLLFFCQYKWLSERLESSIVSGVTVSLGAPRLDLVGGPTSTFS